jgi:hypothetical protein
VVEVPPVQWATTSDGVSLGYQVFGNGPVDMVAIPPFAQNIELAWERPESRRVFERLGRFARVVHFDKRGTAMLFAVTYPHRVDRLVLHATDARIVDIGSLTPAQLEQRRWGVDGVLSGWGTEESGLLRLLAPTAWADPDYRAWEPRYERHSATPAAIRDLMALADSIDVRAVLSSIAVPTLVLHVRDDPVIPIERVRATAAAIRGPVSSSTTVSTTSRTSARWGGGWTRWSSSSPDDSSRRSSPPYRSGRASSRSAGSTLCTKVSRSRSRHGVRDGRARCASGSPPRRASLSPAIS